MYWHIPAIQLGKKYMRNYNTLIGRYDGADGMKTGFICASGFNLVATASRNGKRLIAVVLGSPSSPYRAAKAAGLLERGFHRGPLSWLSPSLGTVESLQPINAAPPDLRDEMCGPHRKRPAAEEADDDSESSSFMLSNLPPSAGKASALLKDRPDAVKAIAVFIGAAKNAAETPVRQRPRQDPEARQGQEVRPRRRQARRRPLPPQAGDRRQAATPTPALQTVSSPPSGAFTPTSGQPQRAAARAAGRDRRRAILGDELCAGGQDRARAADRRAGCQACAAAAAAPAPRPKPKSRSAKPATAAKPAAAKAAPRPKPRHAKQAATTKPPPPSKPRRQARRLAKQ